MRVGDGFERGVRRLFAVPRGTERALVAATGVWLLALAFSKTLALVDLLGALFLDPIQTSPTSWVPRHVLGDLPFEVEWRVMMLTLGAPVVFVLMGLALWPDRRQRPRWLAMFAAFNLLLVMLVNNARPVARENWELFLAYQLSVWPWFLAAFAMVWPHRAARRVTAFAAVLLALAFLQVFWFDGALGVPLPSTQAGVSGVYALAQALRAAVPLLTGVAMLLAARGAGSAPEGFSPTRPLEAS